MIGTRAVQWTLLASVVALALLAIPRGRNADWRLTDRGWPLVWFAGHPAYLHCSCHKSPVYEKLVEASDEAWMLGEIGPNWAADALDSSRRWYRLPNGQVVQLAPRGLLGNLGLAAASASLVVGWLSFGAKRRIARRPPLPSLCAPRQQVNERVDQ